MTDPIANKKPRLGRSLDDSIGPASSSRSAVGSGAPKIFEAPIEDLHPNRNQPRTRFDDAPLDELAASIRELGILEPILVRHRGQGGGYEIIAGERRWRAAGRAGLREVPVYVRELSPAEAFEAALVENLQREDLNPVETARAFQRLLEEHGHTQDTVAARIGKDRSTVANSLRLLKLPEPVLARVESGELSEGHGRALLGAPDVGTMTRLARQALEKSWSVRETERRARAEAGAKQSGAGAKKAAKASVNVRDLETRLSKSLGAKVTVSDRRGKGQLHIAFASYDELDRIIDRILR